ncbi:MAG: DUF3857 and transglutaminase domain-containing protein [Rudaea sp.]
MHSNRRPVARIAGLGLVSLGSFILQLAGNACAANSAKPYSPGWKYRTDHVTIDVAKDGATTVRREYAYTILAESALKSMSEQSISYHENDGSLQDVVAYTLKKDGTRIDVPETNVQVTSHNGVNGAPPAFSDYKDRRIVYPNVEVGDTVVLAYTVKDQKPTFRNHYSLLTYFGENYAYDDAVLAVTAPVSLGLRQKTYNLDAPQITKLDRGRQRWQWHYRNLQPKDDRDESSLYQRVWHYQDWPAIEISNFRDYGQIAAAYADEASRRARVTDRIAKLAGEVVKGASGKREKAEKIYAWIAKNISFAGNCLSGGDVVPRDTDLILNMQMGDCKDHSTLMQAMLSAEGIKSTQVLINTGDWYELPEVPCWQAFNHVIDYLPDFKIYADATSSSSPFGEVPMQDRGKPVIHASAYNGVERIPMDRFDANWSDSANAVTIHSDGSVNVVAKYRFGGMLANALGQSFHRWKTSPDFNGGAAYLKRMLQQMGYRGSGDYENVTDTSEPSEKFSYAMHYRVEDYLDTSNPYGLTLAPLFPSPNPIANLAAFAATEHYDHDFLCRGDKRSEELSYAFPDNVRLLAVPRDVHVQTALLRYDATYERQGNTLHITRAVVDTTTGPVCAAQTVAQYAQVAEAIKKDMKAQAIYQPK